MLSTHVWYYLLRYEWWTGANAPILHHVQTLARVWIPTCLPIALLCCHLILYRSCSCLCEVPSYTARYVPRRVGGCPPLRDYNCTPARVLCATSLHIEDVLMAVYVRCLTTLSCRYVSWRVGGTTPSRSRLRSCLSSVIYGTCLLQYCLPPG